MSKQWTNTVKQFAGLKGYTFGLLKELADMANSRGECRAKQPTLAKSLGCCDDTIWRAAVFLEAGGYIRREIVRKKNGAVAYTRYFMQTADQVLAHQREQLAAEAAAELAAIGPGDDGPGGPGRPVEPVELATLQTADIAAAANVSTPQPANVSTPSPGRQVAAARRQRVAAGRDPEAEAERLAAEAAAAEDADLAQRLKSLGHDIPAELGDDPPARRAAG